MCHNAKFLMPQQECMVIIVSDPSHLKMGLICGYYCETNTVIVKASYTAGKKYSLWYKKLLYKFVGHTRIALKN